MSNQTRLERVDGTDPGHQARRFCRSVHQLAPHEILVELGPGLDVHLAEYHEVLVLRRSHLTIGLPKFAQRVNRRFERTDGRTPLAQILSRIDCAFGLLTFIPKTVVDFSCRSKNA